MKLAKGFRFSQGSLQDFIDCRRRFELRYITRQAWPAVESEPYLDNEHFMQQGQRFHQLVQQYFVGISMEKLSTMIQGPDLMIWWGNFREFMGVIEASEEWKDFQILPETIFSVPIEGDYLLAKLDLLLINEDGRSLIYDWKTSRKRPRRLWLLDRLQTRVYPYVYIKKLLLQNQLPEGGIDKLKMIYWFTDYPDGAVEFSYSEKKYREDEDYLTSLVTLIHRLEEDEFSLTTDEKKCRFCVYRSLCGRGIMAGTRNEEENTMLGIDWVGDLSDMDLDFDQVPEIEF
jgi:hypothetical protein